MMKTAKRKTPIARFRQGFTLFEVVIVLAIVAVLAVISVPAIVNTLTHQELASATNSFVNQVEFARVQAASRNRAYRLRVDLSDGTNSGAIHLDEGIGSACTQETFLTNGIAPDPVEDVRTVVFDTEFPAVRIESVVPSDLAATSLCIKPDGRVLRLDTRSPVAPEADTDYAAGEAIYGLRLYSQKSGEGNASPTSMARSIVVPYNGIPKVY